MTNAVTIDAPGKQELAETDWTSVAILWFAGIGAAMQFAKISVSFAELQEQYGADPTQMGFILSVVGVVGLLLGVVAGVVAGVLAGRLGYRRVLIIALLIGTGLSLVQALAPPMPLLLASRLVEGISHLGIVVAAPTMIVIASAPRHQSLTMGLWGSFFGVAFALAGWVGPSILSMGGPPMLFVAHAILLMVVALCALRLPKPPGTRPDALAGVSSTPRVQGLVRDNLAVYANPRIVLPGIVFFFHTAMFIALLTFVPRLTADPSATSHLLVILPLTSIAGTFLAGLLAQYLIPPQGLALLAYGAVAVLSIGVAMSAATPLALIAFATALLLASGLIQGASFAMIPYLARNPEEQATANGAVAQLGNLGSTIGPPVFALAIDAFGAAGMLGVVGALALGGAITSTLAIRFGR